MIWHNFASQSTDSALPHGQSINRVVPTWTLIGMMCLDSWTVTFANEGLQRKQCSEPADKLACSPNGISSRFSAELVEAVACPAVLLWSVLPHWTLQGASKWGGSGTFSWHTFALQQRCSSVAAALQSGASLCVCFDWSSYLSCRFRSKVPASHSGIRTMAIVKPRKYTQCFSSQS